MLKALWRLLMRLIGTTALLAGLVLGVVYSGLWLIEPKTEGQTTVNGITDTIDIYRDQSGIPHIFAQNELDAYFALGYVHAQDRFWQMESMRRMGAGRLSEIVGSPALASDKWMRTLRIYTLAQQQYTKLPVPVKQAIDAYTRGVNTIIAGQVLPPAPELLMLHYSPELWKPEDTLIWGKLMALKLSGNWQDELLRAQLFKTLLPEQINDMWPNSPFMIDPEVSSALPSGPEIQQLIASYPLKQPGTPKGASNIWAISGTKTGTTAPILANDPHLGFSAPVLWYLAHIDTPTLKLSGATVPGVPFMILGHNQSVAWGVTATETDLQDLFVEKLDTRDPQRYETPTGLRPFYQSTQVIEVKDESNITLTLRQSHHGPVISDILPALAQLAGNDHVIALSATALLPNDRTYEAYYNLNRAKDVDQFKQALQDFTSPQVNFVFSDQAGHMAMFSPGHVPIRKSGTGMVPSPGWQGKMDWDGFIPFAELPGSVNPPSGFIINANNKITPPDYPYFITRDWAPGFRASRITELLKLAKTQTIDYSISIQKDTNSTMANELLPLMLNVVPPEGVQSTLHHMLSEWNGDMSKERPEPLIFTTWLRELNIGIYRDELSNLTPSFLSQRPVFIHSVLSNKPYWCDDVTTPESENCHFQLLKSLERTAMKLTRKYGPEPTIWQWSSEHIASFPHVLLDKIPLINRIASLEVATDGGNYTVNRGTGYTNSAKPFQHRHGPGFRAIYNLADLKKSQFMIATGQSGHLRSPHYRDMLTDWSETQYRQFTPSRRALEGVKSQHLTLHPALSN